MSTAPPLEFRYGTRSRIIPASNLDQDPRGIIWIYQKPQPNARYSIGCLPDGELVRTDEGSKRIENVNSPAKLLDADGNYVSIANKFRRAYKGKLIGIRPYGASRLVWFTPEHPILSAKVKSGSRLHGKAKDTDFNFEYKPASEIEPNRSWVKFPLPKYISLYPSEIMKHWPILDLRCDFNCGPLSMLDSDFWWLVGLWLADGYCTFKKGANGASITICLNSVKDIHNIKRLVSVVRRLFDRSVCFSVESGVTDCIFGSIQFATFLKNHFGTHAGSKHIPHWVQSLPLECCAALVEGYWEGDGCVEDNRILNFVSISEQLLCDVQDILLRLGIFGACRVLRDEKVHHFKAHTQTCRTKKTFELNVTGENATKLLGIWNMPHVAFNTCSTKNRYKYSFIRDGFLHLRVHRVEHKQYDGYVNNFETSSHSYCSELITTHNCDPTHAIGRNWSRFNRDEDDYRIDNAAIQVFKHGRGNPCKNCQFNPRTLTYDCKTQPRHFIPDYQVAEFAAPVGPEDLAAWVNLLGRMYCGRAEDNQAPVIIEVYPGPGGPCQRTLMEKYGYTNFYRWQYLDTGEPKSSKLEFGWYSSKQSVQHLWSKGLRLLSRRQVILFSPDLIEELADSRMDLILNRGSAARGHDDRVTATLLALWQAHNWTFSIEPDSSAVTTGPAVEWQSSAVSSDHMYEEWNERFEQISAEVEADYA